jgi:hypothetical protein
MSRVTGIVTVGSSSLLARIAKEDKSLVKLGEYVILPRLKKIQQMTDTALKEQFGEGSVILAPGNAMVVSKAESFQVVPLFFYTEFCKWKDRKDAESNMILERSFDPDSDVARKARSEKGRYEVYAEDVGKPAEKQKKYRYVEHLVFPSVIYGDHPLAKTECILSFEKGEFSNGRNFSTAIKMRKIEVEGRPVACPLWAQVWTLQPALRTRGENKWYGFDFGPGLTPVILEEEQEEFMKRHMEVAELFEQKLLVAAGEDDDTDPAATPAANKAF